MTAVREETPRTPPRSFVRAAWILHRALYRFSGGRFGLSRPETGNKFGTMRLTTLGRRSGQPRVAIIGYYEDGPNLVTLAMNGWADAEPGWWLNLQANPDTTATVADGPRAVRARAAAGEERARLWAKFRDYPGWGDDLEGLAARRSAQTAVVVLEPRADGLGGDRPSQPAISEANESGAARTTPAHGGMEELSDSSRGDQARHAVRWPRRLARRHLWIVPGLGLAIVAGQLATQYGVGLLPLLFFGIAPDLPRLLGIGQSHAPGQLASRVVPLFNPMHHPGLPVALVLALAATGIPSPFLFVGAFAWLGHIVIGWGMGDRLRTGDGVVRGRAVAAIG
jgi:deazaflavin-dependent oxidoreductase (nitroreductase family)